jgi:uncharacterized glyoxalase superfamily protein PhnB
LPVRKDDPEQAALVTRPDSCGCSVVGDDPRALDARAVAAAAVAQELGETDDGSRSVGFRDPAGNRWHLGTYCGELRFT